MSTISNVVSECQILECNSSAPSLLHTTCVFVPVSSGGWFRRIWMVIGSVTVLWWRRSREEWVGRGGLYKAFQQLWFTNTRDGYRTRAANWLKSFSPVSSSTSTSSVWLLKFGFEGTDSPGKELRLRGIWKHLPHSSKPATSQDVRTCSGDELLECFGRSPDVFGYGGIPPAAGVVQTPRQWQGLVRPAEEEPVQLRQDCWRGGWGRTVRSGGRQSTTLLLAVAWEFAQMHARTPVTRGPWRQLGPHLEPVWTERLRFSVEWRIFYGNSQGRCFTMKPDWLTQAVYTYQRRVICW